MTTRNSLFQRFIFCIERRRQKIKFPIGTPLPDWATSNEFSYIRKLTDFELIFINS